MAQTILSSREFNQDVAGAKRAAREGSVIVTDRGEPAFVLMTYEAYRRLSGREGHNIVDLLRQPEGADIDFEPTKLGPGLVRPADLS